MKDFDTKVQYLRFRVLSEVARQHFLGNMPRAAFDIPKTIVPGKHPTMRCCVYKERAILSERVKCAMGASGDERSVMNVIDIACDECPMGGYDVTNACRGCLAHHCESVCKFGAISFDNNHVAHIDKSKCRECGACAKVCPYSAIHNYIRPCERACKIKAINMDEEKTAHINEEKCISCGACLYQCPFGAITDKSYILQAIDILKGSADNQNYKTYAVVAPSISNQFDGVRLAQVVTAIKRLGFYGVVEAALGADIVAQKESAELAEKGFLISSCCPAFVDYVRKNFPQLADNISSNLSPMATVSRWLKERDNNCKVVFIGPCTAKKAEIKWDSVRPYVDGAITFEELRALFDSKDIDLESLEDSELDDASYFGRIFARCGGLSDAIAEGIKEQNIDFELKPVFCDGIEACRVAMLKKSRGLLDANFIEGMACVGGCIGGAGCISRADKDIVDDFGNQASNKTIADAVAAMRSKL